MAVILLFKKISFEFGFKDLQYIVYKVYQYCQPFASSNGRRLGERFHIVARTFGSNVCGINRWDGGGCVDLR